MNDFETLPGYAAADIEITRKLVEAQLDLHLLEIFVAGCRDAFSRIPSMTPELVEIAMQHVMAPEPAGLRAVYAAGAADD